MGRAYAYRYKLEGEFDLQEVADLLGLHKSTVYRYAREKSREFRPWLNTEMRAGTYFVSTEEMKRFRERWPEYAEKPEAQRGVA